MTDHFCSELLAKLPNLRRFALSLCRCQDTADDLVQHTVEKALAARETFDLSTRIEAWLFRILRNAWIDMARRRKIRGDEVDITETPEAAPTEVHQGDTRLMITQVMAAMKTLSDEHREVLILVCVEELSYQETAGVLGVPKGTVMSRLSRARTALALKLGIH